MTAETTRTVKATATDPRHGMTLDEVAAFVQAAMKAEMPGGTVVKQTTTWKGSIKKLEVTG